MCQVEKAAGAKIWETRDGGVVGDERCILVPKSWDFA
jgi:hypothetical protein